MASLAQKSITNNQSASLAQIGLSRTDQTLLHRSDSLAWFHCLPCLSCLIRLGEVQQWPRVREVWSSKRGRSVRERPICNYWLLISDQFPIGLETSHEKVREAVCESIWSVWESTICVREVIDLTASLAKSASLAEIKWSDWLRARESVCERGPSVKITKFLTFDSNSTSDLKNQIC